MGNAIGHLHGELTTDVGKGVVTSLSTRHNDVVDTGTSVGVGSGSGNRLRDEHILGITIAETVIEDFEDRVVLALLARIITHRSRERSLTDGKRAIDVLSVGDPSKFTCTDDRANTEIIPAFADDASVPSASYSSIQRKRK